jgi:hypothetical protein
MIKLKEKNPLYMESSDEFPIRMKDPEIDEEEYKTINWKYVLIIGAPLLVFSIVIGILALVTPIEFVGSWQIWGFIGLILGLGFIGGFILKRDQLRKSIFWGSIFLIGLVALVMMGLTGIQEILGEGSALEIVIGFFGGLFWGVGIGLAFCIFLILFTIGSFYLKKLISNIQANRT